MNRYLGRCVEEFERVSGEIGFLPAVLWATLIIVMIAIGFVLVAILAAVVLACSPLVLAFILVAAYRSRKSAEVTKPLAFDTWLSE